MWNIQLSMADERLQNGNSLRFIQDNMLHRGLVCGHGKCMMEYIHARITYDIDI